MPQIIPFPLRPMNDKDREEVKGFVKGMAPFWTAVAGILLGYYFGNKDGYVVSKVEDRVQPVVVSVYSHDFNEDGLQDLLIKDGTGNDPTIMIGKEDGSFIGLREFYKEKEREIEKNPYNSLMYGKYAAEPLQGELLKVQRAANAF